MKLLKKLWKRKLLFVGVLISLYILGSFVYKEMLMLTISKKGAIVTEEKLMRDLTLIGNDELKVKRISFYDNDKATGPYNEHHKYGSAIKRGKYVYEFTKTKSVLDNLSKPYEIRQAMRTWIYLKNRNIPFEVTDVYIEFSPFMNFHQVSITQPEFEELYTQAIKEQNYDDEKLVDVLSKAWIEENNYRKWWHD